MSKWTNVRKFDFVKEEYSNSYYKLNEFDYFVDSEFGSDTNDGLTPQTAFKTIDKIATIGISKDSIIAISGNFTALTNHNYNYAVRFVGVGGHNGRAIISGGIIFNGGSIAFENCIQKDCFFNPLNANNVIRRSCYHLNCIQYGIHALGGGGGGGGIGSICLIHSISLDMSGIGWTSSSGNPSIHGYNSTFQSDVALSFALGTSKSVIKNSHVISSVNNTYSAIYYPSVLVDTDSRYFTDNTETTPADLYIDSANGNYGIVPTFDTPIWDKQTQQYITANPLYHTGADGANIGAGVETLALTALDDSLKSTDNGGDATYTNMDNPTNSVVCRIDDSIDGVLESGVQDLGRVMNGVKIDAIATYDTNGGLITKRLQQSTPSIEQTTDFGIQFGETQQECEDMTPILCEYGKVITYSKSGNIMYGNSDLNFSPSKKKVAKFRYFIISIRAKTIS